MVWGAATFLPVAVLASGPMVTWYWVLGARLPLAGCTASVFASHEKVTVVAGVICTACSVDGWSMGWLNETRMGCWSATLRLPSTLPWMTTRSKPPGCCRAFVMTRDAIRSRPAVAPAQASAGGANTRRHQELRPWVIDHASFMSCLRSPVRNASSSGGSGVLAAFSIDAMCRRSSSFRTSSSSGSWNAFTRPASGSTPHRADESRRDGSAA